MNAPTHRTVVSRLPLLRWSFLLFVVALYLPTLAEIWHTWSTHRYAAHAIFAPILSALMLWARRRERHGHAGSGCSAGLVLLGVAAGLGGVGHAVQSIVAHVVSVVLAVWGLALWLRGTAWTRRAAIPLGFLLFMLPLPHGVATAVTLPLQHFAARFAAGLLELFHIPVSQAGGLRVDESGNGLPFLMVLLVVTTAFALTHLPTWGRRLTVIAAAIPAAMLANGIRVAVTAAAAHLVGPQAATGSLHDYAGRAIWALTLVSILGFGVLLGWHAGPRGRAPSPADVEE
jgi:exosortase